MSENLENDDFGAIDLNVLSDMDTGASLETPEKKDKPADDKPVDSSLIDEKQLALEEESTSTLEDELKDLKGSEEGKENKNNAPNSGGSPSSSQKHPVSLLAQTLHEEGVLAGLTAEEINEIKDTSSLIAAIQKQVKESEFADLDEDQKQYIQLLRAGIPDTNARQNVNNIKLYNSIKEEDLEGEEKAEFRKQILKNEFLSKGFSSEKADVLVKRSVDLGEDTTEAKEALKSLRAFEKAKADESLKQAEAIKTAQIESQKKKLKELEEKVFQKEEYIKGVKVNEATKKKVYESMTKIVSYDDNGNPMNEMMAERSKNPTEFDSILNYLFVVTNKFTDLSKLKTNATTAAMKELEQTLEKQTTSTITTAKSEKAKSLYQALSSLNPKTM